MNGCTASRDGNGHRSTRRAPWPRRETVSRAARRGTAAAAAAAAAAAGADGAVAGAADAVRNSRTMDHLTNRELLQTSETGRKATTRYKKDMKVCYNRRGGEVVKGHLFGNIVSRNWAEFQPQRAKQRASKGLFRRVVNNSPQGK